MNNYISDKVYPYVYIGTHKLTGNIYIGSRTSKNIKLPPEQDLKKYKTSSKYVKPIFDEFDWVILCMFFNPIDAHIFEQELIFSYWGLPKLVNKSCTINNKKLFSRIGCNNSAEAVDKARKTFASRSYPKRIKSDEEKQYLRELFTGRPVSNETKTKISNSLTGKPKSETHKKNIALSNSGKTIDENTRSKIRDARIEYSKNNKKIWVNNGVIETVSSSIPDGFIKGRLQKNNNAFTDGTVYILRESCPEGFTKSGWKNGNWYTNGIVEVKAKKCPDGFYAGRLSKKWCNNGIIEIRSNILPDQSFIFGRLKNNNQLGQESATVMDTTETNAFGFE